MIEGSINTANGEKMKIRCEGKVNVSHLTKTEYESKGTLSVKVTEVWHMAHFWVLYGRCTMPGSSMGRSEGLSRRWSG